jgi:hypothetical protein
MESKVSDAAELIKIEESVPEIKLSPPINIVKSSSKQNVGMKTRSRNTNV